MNCKDFHDIVDSYLSDELLIETNHEIMRHMETCANCADVIEARREIRGRLRNAVKSAPEYILDSDFDHKLMTRLRYESAHENRTARSSIFGLRIWAAAAGLLVAGMIGFGLYSNFGGKDSSQYLVSGFAEDSLVNIASGDHQNCAVSYDLDESPVPLVEAGAEFQGLDRVIEAESVKRLSGHTLVESHACTFKNVRFAHFVLSGPDDTISVLVAPTGKSAASQTQGVSEFKSSAYEISNFPVEQNTVFVISNRGTKWNRLATEAFERPIEQHFEKQLGVQTAMLTTLIPFPSSVGH